MPGSRLQLAMLCHSTNARGGVAHALAIAEALSDRGHRVVVHAPDPEQHGFPRAARCGLVSVPAAPAAAGGLPELVAQRIDEYADYFARHDAVQWDVLHAHDGIGANALIRLQAEGRICGFVRTVHHLDAFADPRLSAWQAASVRQAEAVACVSAVWQAALRADFGVEARLIGNGVDAQRFSPAVAPIDFEVRRQYALDSQRPLILSVGGVEARKNSLRLLEAFLRLRRHHPTARLLVVGGASLLDHARVRDEFLALLARGGLAASETGPVTLTGPVPDAHMAPLFRAANVFAFPSLTEGFGLAVLEALACGTPVVTSRIPPFTEYLNETHCRFAQPDSVSSIAAALEQALDPWIRATVRPSGIALARSMGWESCALRQEALYQSVLAHRKQGGPEYHA